MQRSEPVEATSPVETAPPAREGLRERCLRWKAGFDRWFRRNDDAILSALMAAAMAIVHANNNARDHARPPHQPAAQVHDGE
jgi:hypothetical protein